MILLSLPAAGEASERGAARSPSRDAAVAGAIGFALLVAAILSADASTATGQPPLARLTAWIEPLATAGGMVLHGLLGAPGVAVALGVAAATGLAILSLRNPAPDAPSRLFAALALGLCAQVLGTSGSEGLALLLYAAAAALWGWRRAPGAPPQEPRRATPALWLVALAVYSAFALHELDVHPGLHFDEIAYLQAGHMWRGALAPGPIDTPLFDLYTYDRFRAQPLPLALHGLALTLLHPSLVALRLASVAIGAVGLWIAASTLRRSCGDAVATWTLVLVGASPLFLYYHRTGFYIAVSVLHGVLCFAALSRFARRADVGSAVGLGGLVGIGAGLYQISWFVPGILAAVLCLAGRDALRRSGRTAIAWGAVAALVAALPLLAFPGALGTLIPQTLVKSAAFRPEAPSLSGALTLLPDSTDATTAETLRGIALAHAGSAALKQSRRGRSVLAVTGSPESVAMALSALEQRGARVLADSAERDRPFAGAARALRRMFFAPHVSFVNQVVDVPIVNALLAPLLVLGVVEAWRRRREIGPRILLVWSLAAVLLPTAVTDALPRRLVLALPWLYALMALALCALGAALERTLPAARRRGLPISLALAVLCWGTGAHLYFAHWFDRFGPGVEGPEGLAVVRAVKAAEAGAAVGLLPALMRHRSFVARLDPGPFGDPPRRLISAPNASADALRRATCEAGLPAHWIGPDRRDVARAFDELSSDFALRTAIANRLRTARLSRALPGACDTSALPR